MAADVYQLIILGSVGGEFFENVLNFESSVTGSTQPLVMANNLVAAWILAVENDFAACLPNDCLINGYKCKRINNTGGPTYMAPQTPVPGTRPAACLVTSLAPLITQSYIETATMKHRTGRIFLPGIADGDVIDNELSAGLLASISTLCTDLTTALSHGGFTFQNGVWSRKYSRFYLSLGTTSSLLIGTQRRRLHPVL